MRASGEGTKGNGARSPVPRWLAASVAITWRVAFLVLIVLAVVFALSRAGRASGVVAQMLPL